MSFFIDFLKFSQFYTFEGYPRSFNADTSYLFFLPKATLITLFYMFFTSGLT
jgi:hypothetical protein